MQVSRSILGKICCVGERGNLRWRDPPGINGIGDWENGGERFMVAVKRGWRRGGVVVLGRKLAEDVAAMQARRGVSFMMRVRVNRFDISL